MAGGQPEDEDFDTCILDDRTDGRASTNAVPHAAPLFQPMSPLDFMGVSLALGLLIVAIAAAVHWGDFDEGSTR